MENAYSELINNWFNAYDYKYVNTTEPFLSELTHFYSFSEYLKSSPLIYYTVVINACEDEIKQYALEKAKSVYFDIRNKREYPLRLYLYLWEDDSYDSLTTEDIMQFGKKSEPGDENQYYYRDEGLENYSL